MAAGAEPVGSPPLSSPARQPGSKSADEVCGGASSGRDHQALAGGSMPESRALSSRSAPSSRGRRRRRRGRRRCPRGCRRCRRHDLGGLGGAGLLGGDRAGRGTKTPTAKASSSAAAHHDPTAAGQPHVAATHRRPAQRAGPNMVSSVIVLIGTPGEVGSASWSSDRVVEVATDSRPVVAIVSIRRSIEHMYEVRAGVRTNSRHGCSNGVSRRPTTRPFEQVFEFEAVCEALLSRASCPGPWRQAARSPSFPTARPTRPG